MTLADLITEKEKAEVRLSRLDARDPRHADLTKQIGDLETEIAKATPREEAPKQEMYKPEAHARMASEATVPFLHRFFMPLLSNIGHLGEQRPFLYPRSPYEARVKADEDKQVSKLKQAREENPNADTAYEIGGMLFSPLKGAGAAKKLETAGRVGRTLVNAGRGALASAERAAGEGRDSDVGSSAAFGGVAGGVGANMPLRIPAPLAGAGFGAASERAGRVMEGGWKELTTEPEAMLGPAAAGAVIPILAPTFSAAAMKIWNRNSPGGRDLRTLTMHGSKPKPYPAAGSPVKNSPAEEMGVQPNAMGRGIVGERDAARMKDELETRSRLNSQRLNQDELPKAMGKQGDRTVSVQPLIASLEEQLGTPSTDVIPGRRTQIETAIRVLRGELEPTALINLPANVEHHNSPRIPVELSVKDPNWKAIRDIPDEIPGPDVRGTVYRGGKGTRVIPHERPMRREEVTLNASRGRTEEDYTAHAGGGDQIEVGIGDVRGRTGDEPNHVRSIRDLNAIRDAFDYVAKADKIAAGADPKAHPFYALANQIRHEIVPKQAPAVALANRRFHDNQRKTERTYERMKDAESKDPESFGVQLATHGNEKSETAGARQRRMMQIRDQFPVSERMTKNDIYDIMNHTPLLRAEERAAFGPVSGVTGTARNNRSQFANRVVHPALEGIGLGIPRLQVPIMMEISRRARDKKRKEQEKRP